MSQSQMPPGGAGGGIGGGPNRIIQHSQPGFGGQQGPGGQPGIGGQPRPPMPGGGMGPAPSQPGQPPQGAPANRPPGAPINGGTPGATPTGAPSAPASQAAKIQSLGTHRQQEDRWKRTPNTTGTGAVHVKTFHCKLTEDALHFMDQAINEWLDAHPQYEVKFVTSSIGTFTGKLKEPALICQVWV